MSCNHCGASAYTGKGGFLPSFAPFLDHRTRSLVDFHSWVVIPNRPYGLVVVTRRPRRLRHVGANSKPILLEAEKVFYVRNGGELSQALFECPAKCNSYFFQASPLLNLCCFFCSTKLFSVFMRSFRAQCHRNWHSQGMEDG